MKNIYIIISLLFTSNLLANENIIDKSHKSVVNTLKSSTVLLPEKMQTKADKLISDIDKDGKNLDFNINYKHYEVSYHSGDDGDGLFDRPYTFDVVSIETIFLPNTWKINLSYSIKIADNSYWLGGGAETLDEFEEEMEKPSNYKFDFDEGDEEFQILDLYMEPIENKFGTFGFGYSKLQSTEKYGIFYGVILDKQDKLNGNAFHSENSTGGVSIVRKVVETDTYTLTYKPKNYDLGLFYQYIKSNNLQIKEDFNFVFSPDTTANVIAVGYKKTFQDLKKGFNLKTLTYGIKNSKHEFYNYNTRNNDSFSESTHIVNIDLLYMFASRFYINGQLYTEQGGNLVGGYTKLEVGMIF